MSTVNQFNGPGSPVPVWEAIPYVRGFDSTLKLYRQGYCFVSRCCKKLDSDIFATRLVLHPVVCVRGEEAARMFYQPGRFTRRRVFQPTSLKVLRDYGSAQLLDGDTHRQRKAMLMSLLGPAGCRRMVDLAETRWRERFARWPGQPKVELLAEAEAVLFSAAYAWSGLPGSARQVAHRTSQFSAMIDGAATVGPRYWKAMLMRLRARHWMRKMVQGARVGEIDPPCNSALAVIVRYHEFDGELITEDAALVEMMNMLRPPVGVARYVVFGALAMHEFPEWRERIASGDEAALTMFVREVLRYYPVFNFVGGRACYDFQWKGMQFDMGTWVLLDLYGTDHDPGTWPDPEAFRPERFDGWVSSCYDLIALGGGEHYNGHRCAGEAVTIELTKSALRLLSTELEYRVPRQDLRISLKRMPTRPASGFIIDSVRPVARKPAPAMA